MKNSFKDYSLSFESFQQMLNSDAKFERHVYKKYVKDLVELIKLQEHLQRKQEKMIILFEGRDASGKGGTIRCVTRYMNEKHYRVVALASFTQVLSRLKSWKNS